MFKKLRIKFIAITMAMVAIVMALAFTVVCIVEYQRSYSVVQTALDDAVQQAIEESNWAKNRFNGQPGAAQQGARPDGSSTGKPPSEESSGSSAASSSADGNTGTEALSDSKSAANAAALLIGPATAYALEPQDDGQSFGGGTQALGDNGQGPSQDPNRDPSRNPGHVPLPNPGNDPNGQDEQNGQPNDSARSPAENPGNGQANPNNGDTSDGSDADDSGSGQNADSADDATSGNTTYNTSSTDGSSKTRSTSSNADSSSSSSAGDNGRGEAASGNGNGASGTSPSDEADVSPEGDSVTISDEDMGQAAPPSIGNRPGQQRSTSSLVPVAVYKIGPNGMLRVVPEITTASISSDVLQQAAGTVIQADDGFGTLANMGLHYYRAENDGTTYLAFADTSYTDGWKSLALILVGAGAGTLVVFLVISLFYSRWALRPVREAWDSQRQFVADASHDLKTPITVILANASILLKHPDHTIASESQWIESTQKEAENMQGLVNEMLELAQIESGQQAALVREPVDLSDLIDGETLLFDSVALERNCTFNCQIEQGITVCGDEKQIKKMVSTLVENAFKYVDDEGAIDIVARKAGKNALIDISNSGSAIPPADLPHIFDRFYRTDKARTSDTGGFGLGLAIAREVALRHDGDIACASNPEEGTTFTITLPLA